MVSLMLSESHAVTLNATLNCKKGSDPHPVSDNGPCFFIFAKTCWLVQCCDRELSELVRVRLRNISRTTKPNESRLTAGLITWLYAVDCVCVILMASP